MVALPYKNVTWPLGAPLVTDKLNQMANNDQWLFENMPRMQYTANNVKRASGVKIIAGQTRYPATYNAEYVGVATLFGNFFTPGCQPIVSATPSSNSSPHRLSVTICAYANSGNEVVDHRGFSAFVQSHPFQATPGQWTPVGNSGVLHWIAVGY